MSYAVTERLLERDDQLADLDRLFRGAVAGHGGLALLAGEAGVGKTALIEAFCTTIRAEFRVVVGRCDPLATPRPLGPLLDIAPLLGARLEMLLGSGDRPLHVFTEALDQLGQEPTVVVFEDLHWADEATLDLVRFLGRRLTGRKTLLVCSYRDDELDPSHPLRIALGDLAGSSGVHRIVINPLSEAAVVQLAEGTSFDSHHLYGLTAGNPFFVSEVVAAGNRGIPPTVSDAVLARLSRLSPRGRHALEAAAVGGDPIDMRLLTAAFDVDAGAVAECLQRGFLVESGGRLAFRHQLTRNAVLESVPAPIRGELHGRMVAAARERGVMPDELASLAEHAEFANDAKAVLEFAPAAARWASRLGAHREAAAQYARSVQFAEGREAEIVVPLIEGWALELLLIGQNERAAELRTRAATLWHEIGNRTKEADNIRWRSRSVLRIGNFEQALRLANQAVKMLEPLPAGRELAWAYGNLAHLAHISDQYRECLALSEKSLALAKRLGDEELVVFGLHHRGMARLWLGEQTGRAEVLESARLATEMGLSEHDIRAHMNLASFYAETFEPVTADDHIQHVLEYFPGAELEDMRRHALALRSLCRVLTGAWADAVNDANEALDSTNRVASTSALALSILARVAGLTGRTREAADLLDRATAYAMTATQIHWLIHQVGAEVAWLAGDMAQLAQMSDTALAMHSAETPRIVIEATEFWVWRTDNSQRPSGPPSGPFGKQMRGLWTDAAAAWERRGCPYEAAVAKIDGDDPDAIRQALQTFDQLGAEPAAAMARRKLRQLGVSARRRRASKTTRAHPAGLTRREAEVLDLLPLGLTNPQIAKRLFLAPKTVEHHVSSVLAKLGATNRTDAVRIAKETPQPEPTAPKN